MARSPAPATFRFGSPPRQGVAIDVAAVFFFVGVVIVGFGVAMLLPAFLDLIDDNLDYAVFLTSAGISIFAGLSLALACHRSRHSMGGREVTLAVSATWCFAVVVGSLPFMFSQFGLSFVDAVFETMSGLTATGSTVIVGLEGAPRGLLFWRFLLIWMGGFGVVTVMVLVLPFLRIGGQQLFTIDLSAQSGKILPRATAVVAKVGAVYATLTLVCALAFRIEGMSGFDAIGHAMAAIATGGFSSHDSGIGFFKSPAIEWTASIFMLLSALPFVLHARIFGRGPAVLFEDAQVILFLVVIGAALAAIALWLMTHLQLDVLDAARQATFNVVSIISTTGFTSQDFVKWGDFPLLVLLVCMLVGGCTGSTAGGVKMFRLVILLRAVRAQIHRQIFPHVTNTVAYNKQPVADQVRAGVGLYFFVYLATFLAFALALGFVGLSFVESVGASATALGGVGPGLGGAIGPCCTFAPIPDAAKWLLSLEMLAGRLEILVLVVPLTRTFWRS
ncbi:MAG TPA: TrkH family potassium uptake protein [Rhodospirillales bacterium]|nr:TrkH family potassium uptake protein [Rhodospirillales bacterium]